MKCVQQKYSLVLEKKATTNKVMKNKDYSSAIKIRKQWSFQLC